MQNLNFVFWGTPDVASDTLDILKEAGFLPSLVITSPDAKKGRGLIFTPSPVKEWAQKNNIKYIEQLEKIENSDMSLFDISIVVAYGKILPEEIIKMPKLGSINIHYSLLPKYRGASPVESAILNGETETGVAIQQMEFKMDAGPIIVEEKVAILPDEKAGELRKRLIKIGGDLLVKTLPNINKIKPIPQDETKATNCKKIKKEDGLIDLDADATTNYNKFRAYATWPRTFFFKDGKRVIITKATLENNQFVIKKIIPESGKEIEYKTSI